MVVFDVVIRDLRGEHHRFLFIRLSRIVFISNRLKMKVFVLFIPAVLSFAPSLHTTTTTVRNNAARFSSNDDLVDTTTTTVMNDFFLANNDWQPLFRSLAVDASVPAMSILGGDASLKVVLEDLSGPWKQLEAVPTDDDDRKVVAGFLDSMQEALLAIPVISEEEDAFDLQFIEEGRRMLCVSRFQVLSSDKDLFSTCWNELHELSKLDQPNTGSMIVLPEDYDLELLQSFTDENLQQPLEWLGLDLDFEIASITRGIPALRMLHKLSDIPEHVGEDADELE